MEKKIILLSRVSTSPQDISSQTNDLIKKAKELGYDEKHQIIIEDVESAIKLSEEERLGLQKMKQAIEGDSSIDCVMCWEPSRLARQQKILYSIRDYLFDRKIQLYILNPFVSLLTPDRTKIDTSASIVFSLFSTLAENEMMLKKERFMRARNNLKSQGKKSAGPVIFGYMKDKDKRCVPHPEHSKIVVDIFNHYVTTDSSCYDNYLYANGKWPELFPVIEYKKGQHKMTHLLDTEIYGTGNWCYPPLISKDVWDRAHEKKSKAVCRPRYMCKRDLLCRGKIHCKECCGMMTGAGGHKKAYVCNSTTTHTTQLRIDAADYIIWSETVSIVNWNSAIENDGKIYETKGLLQTKISQREQFEEAVKEVNNKLSKIVDLYVEGKIDESLFDNKRNVLKNEEENYTKKINTLTIEINSLTTVLEDAQNAHKGDLVKKNSITIDSVTDFETRQEYVRKYIKNMWVEKIPNEKKLRISFEYNMPVISNGNTYIYDYTNLYKLKVFLEDSEKVEDLSYLDIEDRHMVMGDLLIWKTDKSSRAKKEN